VSFTALIIKLIIAVAVVEKFLAVCSDHIKSCSELVDYGINVNGAELHAACGAI
jgi:hypothetical protein